jgi:hypothetical protein
MSKLTYTLTIQDNGSEDKNIVITLIDNRTGRSRMVVDALIPAINHLKQTLCDDVEGAF